MVYGRPALCNVRGPRAAGGFCTARPVLCILPPFPGCGPVSWPTGRFPDLGNGIGCIGRPALLRNVGLALLAAFLASLAAMLAQGGRGSRAMRWVWEGVEAEWERESER